MTHRWPWRLGWSVLLVAALAGAWACGPKPNGGGGVGTTEAPPDPDLQGPDLFEDVTAPSGVRFTYDNGENSALHLTILESLGGGAALIDYDGDGLLDVFLPGGGTFTGDHKDVPVPAGDQPYVRKDYPGRAKRDIVGRPSKLFRNLGKFKFEDVTAKAGLDRLAGGAGWFYTHGAAVGDYDRDGWPDLLVTGWGRVALFRNVADGKGGRRFEDVTAKVGLDRGVTWGTSAAFADLDGDGWPDLYVAQYADWSWKNNPPCAYDGRTPDVCAPKEFSGLVHKVYRNTGQGGFVDVSQEVGLRGGGKDSSKGLGVLVVDVNGDGRPDVYVANDTTDNFLYMNVSTPGKIRFKEEGMLAGVARDEYGTPNGSMGLDAGDPFGDGKPAIWVTNYENELHALYRNSCEKDRAYFLYSTSAAGISALGQKYVGWGTGLVDLDGDGWEDLFIANGHAIRYPKTTTRSQVPVLMRNREGHFKDISGRGGPYFKKPHLSRGLALGDLDNDGKVDAVISHMNEPVSVLRNVSKEGHHWVGVELARAGGADFVGARVVVEAGGRKQARFAKGGGSYASSPDRRLLFGLGGAKAIDKVTVEWPDGQRQEWSGLAVDRYHRLTQGQKDARALYGAK